jgi:hypothetical protein
MVETLMPQVLLVEYDCYCPLLQPALLCGLKPIRPKLISKKMMGPLAELFTTACEERGTLFEGCCVFLQNASDRSIAKYGSKFKPSLD